MTMSQWVCRHRERAAALWILVARPAGVAAFVTLFAVAFLPAHGDVLIDFEEFTGMANSLNAAVPVASQVSTQFLDTDGVRFESGSSFVAVVNLGANHATSGTKGIGGTSAAGGLSYNTAIDAAFFVPGDSATPGETDSVSVRGDLKGVGGVVTLQAFDRDGLLIGTNTQTDSGGPALQVSAIGIHSVTFFSATANVAFDDFAFGPVRAVPEPSSAATLATGMLGVIAIARRRRRTRELDMGRRRCTG